MAYLTNPKVSIVIPVYNGGNFVSQAIESALNQDYKNLEVIIGVNPSTDSTLEKIASVIGDRRLDVRIFAEKVSMVANFNRTANLVSGEYIKFLCHDDVLEPFAVTAFLDFFQKEPSLALATSFEGFIGTQRFPRSFESLGKKDRIGSLHGLYRFAKYGNWLGGPSGVMVKSRTFLLHPFDESLACAFDLDCWIRMVKQGSIGIIPEVLYHSRVHSQQETNRCLEGGFDLDLEKIRDRCMKSDNLLERLFFKYLA